MLKRPPVVALLTDFGTRDHYAGVLKGVLLTICPTLRIIDLSHDVAPQNIPEAAYLLWASFSYLPEGAIALVVVDPGVGTSRDIVIVKTKHHVFVAPDNGVLDYVLWQEKPQEMIVLNEGARFVRKILSPQRSTTFHGRDIFAPVAAHIAAGTPLRAFGRNIHPANMAEPFVCSRVSSVMPRILHTDCFGNIITNILPPNDGSPPFLTGIVVGRKTISRWIKAYEEAPPETPCLMIGSSGLVEIVANKKSAASLLRSSHPISLKLIA